MTAKGLWGWGIAGLVGLGSLFGPPLADSLVKEGKLPEWLSIKIAGWLASEIVIPSWSLVPILLCTGVAGALLIRFLPRTNSDEADRLAHTSVLLEDSQRRCIELEHDNVRLGAANAKLNATTKELNTAKLELYAARSEFNAAQATIADLQTPKVQPLNEHQRIVLAAIMYYENSDEQCVVKDLSQRIKFTMVQTEGAVDVLVKQKLVNEWYTSYGGRAVSLSPDGRTFVLHEDFDMSFLPL